MTPASADPLSALSLALAAGADERARVFTCDAPGGLAERLADLRLTDHSVFWNSGAEEARGKEPTYVGFGAAAVFRLEGKTRFSQAQRQIEETYRALVVSDEVRPHVRFFGGAAFNPGRDGTGPCWQNFGDATFLLPRVTYVDDGQRAQLLCVATAQSRDEILHIAGQILSAQTLSEPSLREQVSEDLPRTLERKDSSSGGRWAELVHGIQDSIRDGEVEKVVAARRLTLHLTQEPVLSAVVARLNRAAPMSARFALRIRDRIFVGATPERLIQKTGRRVSTEALAGSIDSGAQNASETLLASTKDLVEHAYVVEALRVALSPVCQELTVPEQPEIRRLPQLLHLRTPVSGLLKENCHVLSLVERLHPTPAVGGLPKESAVRFIEKHEEAERGWYAAPIGWVNGDGDGEFAVALRSALLCGKKAHVYAGAGIVADSESALEFEETELKLGSMLSALGVSG